MSTASTLERQMLDLINADRAAYGLDPLTLELRLNAASEDHSEWMLDTDRFSHTGSGGSSPYDRMQEAGFVFSGSWGAGENIDIQSERGAPGLADDVADLHQSLMNSPGHRANILNPNFEVIGIEHGEYKGWYGGGVVVTQNFARTGAALQLDQPGSSAPVLKVEDITVGKIKGARVTRLKKHMDYADAEGDAPVWYELLDTEGRDNFRFKGLGVVDAETPYRVAAEDIGLIRVRQDKTPGESALSVRVFDGEQVSDWAEFTLTTLSAEDWLALG
jgi:hypothetical protein